MHKPITKDSSSSGFTLFEVLIVAILIGILAAIIVPSWVSFVELRRLNIAQNQAYLAMRQAQSQATKQKITWQVTFRERKGNIQWTTHPAEAGKFLPDTIKNNDSLWQNFHPNISIDTTKNNKGDFETTFRKDPNGQRWRILFNYQGCPIKEVGDDDCRNINALGQITFFNGYTGQAKRCVYVSTIIGAMRTGKEQAKANENDRYCY
ncbi:MAG: prepilin-type N-terminal cleavage/methylation domain-containing protein [Scytonematopsis contorta HA4267-MV1]|jgi:prepilin-type N-terminal cleavage/methylation domain-containing protein|nr:prepilin-type N-terminal cleavage/methylation domain-containing protein [Scytonematopsis contorta HA4267-MV1]